MSDPLALGLPHREPFVFIDEVLSHVAGESAHTVKTFPASEPFFRGHFPGDPIVPGVILTEALAQTAGIAVGEPGRALRLAAVKAMKFSGAARPGERIDLHAHVRAAMGGLWQFDAAAKVGQRLVAEGVIVLGEA